MADVKRLNYFTSQFLVEKDFKDEQAYVVGMRRRHNQLLHTWGVADGGLEVRQAGDKIVTIGAGMAIDKEGRDLVLLDARSQDLATFGSNVDVYLTLKYQEVSDPDDHYTAGGVDNYTRTTERPLLETSTTVPATDGSVIVLAKVSLDGSGNVGRIDPTVRKRVGSAIDPAVNLVVRSLSVTGNASVDGNVGIGTTATPQQLSITGGLGFANHNAADKKLYSPADGVLEWMTHDAAGQHGLAVSHQGQQRLFFNTNGNSYLNGGNVGIGTTTPENAEAWNKVLDIVGTGHAKLSVRTAAIDARVLAHDTGFWGAPGGMIVGTRSAHPLSFGTNAATRLVINAAGNVGIGTTQPSARLSVVAPGATELDGSARSATLLTAAGSLGTTTGSELPLASLGFRTGNNTSLGVRAVRVANGTDWVSTAIGLGMDVDNTVRAGASLWLHANGNVGIGTTTPSHKFHVVAADAVGLFESSGGQAYLRLSTNEGLGNRVEITNRPGGRLSLWTSGAGDVFNITRDGNVGIGTTTPQSPLHVVSSMSVGPFGLPSLPGRLMATGSVAEIGFTRRSLTAWPAASAAGDRFLWYNPDGKACLYTDAVGDLLQVFNNGYVRLLSNSNPLYFTSGWTGYPDAVTNTSEISNDTGTYKTLMIIGNKSAGLGRRVSVWDRFEVNGTFVNNSSIEAKQDVQALSAEDYQDIHRKLMQTPLYRYRFKASGIDQKLRLGVISEASPHEILDETGKCVSFLDYVGFLFAALKAQANEINRLARFIGATAISDSTTAHGPV